jgi:hypothetical protein
MAARRFGGDRAAAVAWITARGLHAQDPCKSWGFVAFHAPGPMPPPAPGVPTTRPRPRCAAPAPAGAAWEAT